ncbi:sulfite exporter TauE/SafE family protein [bacterium]|nr:sulfite exporter TauE/SafE family protein [bacterium]
MTFISIFCLLIAGAIAGFINVMAGGGSLLTLPALIFFGLPPTVANATNRVGILVQTLFSVAAFKKEGLSKFKYSFFLAISSTTGAAIGASIAMKVKDATFQLILSGVMLIVLGLILWNPAGRISHGKERVEFKHKMICFTAFFFVGIYGGFIQAGVGLIIIVTLTSIHNISLLKTNCIKVTVILIYTPVAVVLFAMNGKINWMYAAVLSTGYAAGGWIASRLSIKKGDKWIKKFLIVAVLIMSFKLSGLFDKIITLF